MQDCIHLHLVRVKLFSSNARSLNRMGAAFLAGRAEEDVLLGHSYVMQEAGANYIPLVYRFAMLVQPSSYLKGIACRFEAVGGNIAVLAMVGNVYSRVKPLGSNDVSSEIDQIIEQRIIHDINPTSRRALHHRGCQPQEQVPDANGANRIDVILGHLVALFEHPLEVSLGIHDCATPII